MPTLGVIVASTREGRIGSAIADWVMACAATHGGLEATLLDLKTIDLPVLSEPNHPRLGKYTSEKTWAWSRLVASADAFVFVSPEYNHGTPPALANAIDHLFAEWQYKPVGFVSYGGVSAGLRAVQMTKQIVVSLKMMPVPEGVAIPFVAQHVEDGRFTPSESQEKAARTMLDELARWSAALRILRTRP